MGLRGIFSPYLTMLCGFCSARGTCVIFLIAISVLLHGCASPVRALNDFAEQSGLQRSVVRAEGYNLLVFDNFNRYKLDPVSNNGISNNNDADILRVYLEGDGSPWQHRTIVMSDPTPRNPLMLRLMSQEQHPAAYIGRPCYNGFENEPGCDNSLWTSARYSQKVIDSMGSAIRAMAKRSKSKQLWLIGHSGGGALAMLLAPQLPQTARIVTLAGNLDTDAWTSHHRYTPLFSSFNPATSEALPSNIWQWHFVGGRDSVVPPQITRPIIMQQLSASGFLMPQFNHGCCWERIWPQVMRSLEQDNPSVIPGKQFKFREPAAES